MSPSITEARKDKSVTAWLASYKVGTDLLKNGKEKWIVYENYW